MRRCAHTKKAASACIRRSSCVLFSHTLNTIRRGGSMTPGSSVSPNADTYAALLARIQPRSIRNEEEAQRVQEHIDALVDQGELSRAEQEILSLLGDLMLAWEQDRFEVPSVSPAEAIRALLE